MTHLDHLDAFQGREKDRPGTSQKKRRGGEQNGHFWPEISGALFATSEIGCQDINSPSFRALEDANNDVVPLRGLEISQLSDETRVAKYTKNVAELNHLTDLFDNVSVCFKHFDFDQCQFNLAVCMAPLWTWFYWYQEFV